MIDAAIDKNSPISHVAVVLKFAIVLSPNIGGTNDFTAPLRGAYGLRFVPKYLSQK